MKLAHRISLLVFIIIIVSTGTNFFLTQYQEQNLYYHSEKILARTLIQSLRDALIQDIIDGNKLRVTNLLRTLREHNNPIEFLYVTQGNKHRVFAHSFRKGFPRYLLNNNYTHSQYSSIKLTGKYQTHNGLIYEYSEPLLKGLDTILHIGINQSEIAQKLSTNQHNIILMSFIVMLLALIIAYLWSRQITAPLALFTEKIQAFGSGKNVNFTDLRKNIPELQVLASAFENAVHERQQAVNSLKEREKNLDITLNSIGDAVITTDALGNITRMNPVASQLTGWSNQEAFGQSVKSIFPIIDATTRESIENPVEKVLSTGQTIYLSNHTTLISRSGTEYQISDSAAPIRNEAGEIMGMVLVFNDITEQYRLREQAARSKRDMQAIMDHSPSVIYVKDTQGRFTFINQKFEELFHITREEIAGKTDFDLFPKDFAREFSKNDKKVLTSTKNTQTLEELVPQDDGIHTYFSVKFPLYDHNNNIYALCGISTDITEQKKNEATLRRSQKMEAIGQLSGGIAHDFNNQLGVVIGYLDFLKQHTANEPKARKWVETATKATLRCIDLTRQLLAFSRKQSTETSPVNINTSLKEYNNMIARSLTPEISVEYFLAENLWHTEINEGEFQDAILNLVINARDAMPQGGKLILETSNTYLNRYFSSDISDIQSGEYIQLMLSDTGSGMDETTLEHLFEPFFTTKSKDKGTGLGMSMVYGFIKRYKGYIKVYSEPGTGTTIRIFLPRSNKEQTIQQDSNPGELPRGNETVLIVDDEPELLQLADYYLDDLGYKTYTAENALQALALLEKYPVDIIFSDVVMPGGMNGYELAQTAVKQNPELKILLTSGFTSKTTAHKGLAKFATHLLSKPYLKSELAQHIRQTLDEKENS